MQLATQNGILVAAFVAGLLSLPTTWMTIRHANLQITPNFGGRLLTPDTDFSGLITSTVTKTSIDVTGLNGHVTFLVKFPIWLIACLAIFACFFLIADNSKVIAFPRPLLWAVAIASLALTILPLVIALGSGRATPGIGWLLGLACAATPVAVLWFTRRSQLVDNHSQTAE